MAWWASSAEANGDFAAATVGNRGQQAFADYQITSQLSDSSRIADHLDRQKSPIQPLLPAS